MCVQINNIRLAGDVTEPKFRTIEKSNSDTNEPLGCFTCRLSIKRDGKQTLSISVKALGKKAEELSKAATAGGFIRFHGSLQTDKVSNGGRSGYVTYLKVSEWYPAARGYYENNAIVCGRFTKDIKLWPAKQTAKAFCTSTIAIRRGSSDEADFIDVNAFDKNAETIDKYFAKGKGFYADGVLKMDTYTGNDQEIHVSYGVAVNRWQFADSKSSSGTAPETGSKGNAVTKNAASGYQSGPPSFDDLFAASM